MLFFTARGLEALGSYLCYILAYVWHVFVFGSCLELVALELLLAYLWHIFALGSCLEFIASELLLAYLCHMFVIIVYMTILLGLVH